MTTVHTNILLYAANADSPRQQASEALLNRLAAGPDLVTLFWPALASVRATGNLVPDAHLITLMRQHGVREIWSNDRDLRKFDGIVVRDPFAG